MAQKTKASKKDKEMLDTKRKLEQIRLSLVEKEKELLDRKRGLIEKDLEVNTRDVDFLQDVGLLQNEDWQTIQVCEYLGS